MTVPLKPVAFLVDNFNVKNNFLEPQNHRNVNTSRPIYLKKFSHTVLKITSA